MPHFFFIFFIVPPFHGPIIEPWTSEMFGVAKVFAHKVGNLNLTPRTHINREEQNWTPQRYYLASMCSLCHIDTIISMYIIQG